MHKEEAAGVHRALELLSRRTLAELPLDSSIAEVLEPSRIPADSLDTVAFVMALEDEIGADIDLADEAVWEQIVFRVVLGMGLPRTTWDSASLPARSIRSVVEERVRLRGGCRT